jgi:hypothetical protein
MALMMAATSLRDLIGDAAPLIAMYPLFTAMWGWDPIYWLTGLRTGKPSASCGTIDAPPLGEQPKQQ